MIKNRQESLGDRYENEKNITVHGVGIFDHKHFRASDFVC